MWIEIIILKTLTNIFSRIDTKKLSVLFYNCDCPRDTFLSKPQQHNTAATRTTFYYNSKCIEVLGCLTLELGREWEALANSAVWFPTVSFRTLGHVHTDTIGAQSVSFCIAFLQPIIGQSFRSQSDRQFLQSGTLVVGLFCFVLIAWVYFSKRHSSRRSAGLSSLFSTAFLNSITEHPASLNAQHLVNMKKLSTNLFSLCAQFQSFSRRCFQ